MQIVVHFLLVRCYAHGAVLVERNDGFGQQARRLQEIIDDDGHEYIQLEIALGCRHADGRIVAHDLHSYHRYRLALGRVNFTGHDGGAGLVFRNVDLA